jgi:pyruvate/2-oxoglutarate dehydrogenase complex dihydrolipoamide acyltransferase (E2) component
MAGRISSRGKWVAGDFEQRHLRMSTKVNFPKSGMGIDEGTVVRWLRQAGDKVDKGDVLVELETAKAVVEVEAPVSGTLATILVAEGDTAAVNAPLALIE